MSASVPFAAGAHVFVDETKARGYVMVATWVAAADVGDVRRSLRALARPRQARMHFQKMSRAERRQAIEGIAGLNVRVRVYQSGIKSARPARAELLAAILDDVQRGSARRVVIERDEASMTLDHNVLAGHSCHRRTEVVHLRSVEEPLLWISDAVACLGRSPWEWWGLRDQRRGVST